MTNSIFYAKLRLPETEKSIYNIDLYNYYMDLLSYLSYLYLILVLSYLICNLFNFSIILSSSYLCV